MSTATVATVDRKQKPWVIGLALFSMFFGSGNLIFPLAVGQFAQEHYLPATLGFCITAVLIPFMGVIAMVMYHGNYRNFFGVFGKPVGFVLTLMLLIFWIPLGSGPRCITLSYGAIQHYIGATPLWLFSLVYTCIVFAITCQKNRIIGLLGRFLTPVLLLILAIVFVIGVYTSTGFGPTEHTAMQAFGEGLAEGYNTQDLIAAFFFSASVIGILTHRGEADVVKDDRPALRLALRASVIGIIILGVVYLGLLYLGAAHASMLNGLSKDLLLPTLVRMLLGDQLGFFAALAIALACMTTSVALALVFTDFLRFSVFHEKLSHGVTLAMICITTFGMSLIGFAGISVILSTAMEYMYPFLIVMIVFNCGGRIVSRWLKKKARAQLTSCCVHPS